MGYKFIAFLNLICFAFVEFDALEALNVEKSQHLVGLCNKVFVTLVFEDTNLAFRAIDA